MSEGKDVDLSKANAGDKVVFRHGGKIPIGRIRSFIVDSNEGNNIGYSLWAGPKEWDEHIGNFSENGINERHPYTNAFCEIVRLEKS